MGNHCSCCCCSCFDADTSLPSSDAEKRPLLATSGQSKGASEKINPATTVKDCKSGSGCSSHPGLATIVRSGGGSCSGREGMQGNEENNDDIVLVDKEVSEWKEYLHKLKNSDNTGSDNDDGSVDEDAPACESSRLDTADDNIPGYFLYITGEGTKIWLLADEDEENDQETFAYSDQDVQELLADTSCAPAALDHSTTFAPYHLSKAEALSNVRRVKASSACVRSYEACLKRQQAHLARRRKLIRQRNMAGVPHEQLSVAERKKLLWDSNGKLATGSNSAEKRKS